MLSFCWFFSLIALALAKCPPNSLHLDINDTVCYSFHSTLSKFLAAQTHCKSFGAQLVSLENEYINSYITGYADLIFDGVVFFWSGGSRLHNPSQLEWSNGAKVEYTHYHKGDELKNGSCLAAEVKQGFWKNENCFAELSYVCQFLAGNNIIPDKADLLDFGGTTDGPDKTTVVPTLPITADQHPPKFYTGPSDATNEPPTLSGVPTSTVEQQPNLHTDPSVTTNEPRRVSGVPTTSITAESHQPEVYTDTSGTTNEPGKNSVVPASQTTVEQHPSKFYTGPSGTTGEPARTTSPIPPMFFTTVITVPPKNESKDATQSTVSETKLQSLSPINHVLYTSSPVPEKKIITTLNYVTESKMFTALNPITKVPPINIDRTCPQGYHYRAETKQCYKFNKSKLMWKDAEAFCQNEGSHLASIENEAENKFIVDLAKQEFPENSCKDETDQPWIGYSKTMDGVFLWSDKSETNYTNWATLHSQPNNLKGNQQCVEMFVSSGCKFEIGSWNDYNCTTTHTFVCKQPSKSILLSPCPLGWKYNSVTNYCYLLNRELSTWEDAEAHCLMNDAHLASINDEDENKFVTDLANGENLNHTCDTSFQTWIGLSKLADNKTWCWIDGSKTGFIKWSNHTYEPNNVNGDEFCVQVNANLGCAFNSGDWNDNSCKLTQTSVCKKPAPAVVHFNTTPKHDFVIVNLTKS